MCEAFSDAAMKALIHARIITLDTVIEDGSILFKEGRIVNFGRASDLFIPEESELIDACGWYVGPGFVDIHCHGGGRFSAIDEPDKAASYHLAHGTTSLTLSIAYNVSYEKTLTAIDAIKMAMLKNEPGNINGIFFEGPYNNPKYGAKADSGRSINPIEYELLYKKASSSIRQWMYAPELEYGDEFARFVVSKGIPLAIGHTCASPADIKRSVDIGASICTHLFDAMGSHLGNDSIKDTGMIQENVADIALITNELFLEIICDAKGVHVKPANLKLAYKCGGPDRVALITDYATKTCMPLFDSEDNDVNVNEKGEISGSLITMDMALKNMHHFTAAPITHLFKMAAATPARAIRIFDTVGSIDVGKYANFVLLDEALCLKKVFLKGELVSEWA
jgi:N-acetylglucosamine-6-phosphate deacetylase